MKQTENNKFSEEVQDIIDRMPANWCAWIASLVLVVMVLFVVAGFVIKYPDTIMGTIIIREGQHAVRIVSPSAGRLHILRKNHDSVREGDVIAYIENGASFTDVMRVDSMCSSLERCDSALAAFPMLMTLGELSSVYSNLLLAYQNYDVVLHTHLYENMRQGLMSKIEADSHGAEFLKEEMLLRGKIVDYSRKHLQTDSVVYASDGMSCEQYEEQLQLLYQKEISKIEANNAYATYMSSIKKSRIEIDKIDIEEQEKLATAYNNFIQSINELRNSIRIWKERYLVTASVSGRIEYLGFWSQKTFVSSAQELFSILPPDRGYFGEMYISALGVGKVKNGQVVNVKVHNFPYNEYGFVKGRVADISSLAGVAQSDAEPSTGTYRVRVEFPVAMHTNYDKDLDVNYEATGVADIVVEKRRLIERLFDNLKARENK